MGRVALSRSDESMLEGDSGEAKRVAMRILVEMARVSGAEGLLDISSAHVDGGLYHGEAGLDFAELLASGGGRVAVPTTMNVGTLDLLHPNLYRGDPTTAERARRLMDVYIAMGCRPTWTCAPYQLAARPAFGEHVAWAESNAIVFANSVLGARTDRYGDFIDICAAITGRAPDAGLHRSENRAGRILFRLSGISDRLKGEDVLYPVLGHLVGARSGARVPVIEGLPSGVAEDALKALGAAAASSGSVAMFHAVGVTPEAPTLAEAFQGRNPAETIEIDPSDVRAARDQLTTSTGRRIDAVSLGTPHFSPAEFEELAARLDGVAFAAGIDFYVSTGRDVLAGAESKGWAEVCRRAGIQIVTDTCTYVTPILKPEAGVVMTNSAKWAFYAPSNLGIDVVFGSMSECVRSAVEGEVWRDDDLWG